MSNDVIDEVVGHVRRGRKMLVRTDHTGQCITKFNTGPFGLFKKRYVTDNPTYERIKANLRELQSI